MTISYGWKSKQGSLKKALRFNFQSLKHTYIVKRLKMESIHNHKKYFLNVLKLILKLVYAKKKNDPFTYF